MLSFSHNSRRDRRTDGRTDTIAMGRTALHTMQRGKNLDVSTSLRGLHQKKAGTQFNVPVAMKPLKMLKGLLVHAKDKQKKEDITEYVNCNKTYLGETGRKLGIRLQEHRMEVDCKTKRAFTRT